MENSRNSSDVQVSINLLRLIISQRQEYATLTAYRPVLSYMPVTDNQMVGFGVMLAISIVIFLASIIFFAYTKRG